MTSSNKFTFDVVANDNASASVQKILASIQALTPALNAAAGAYERMAAAQATLGLKNSNQGQQAAMQQMNQLQAQQVRSNQQLSASADQRAKSENAAMQTRSNLIARASAQEEAANARSEASMARRTGVIARQNAMQQSGSAARIAALDTEIARTQRIAVEESKNVALAQQVAAATRSAATAPAGRGAAGAGASDVRASAAAAQTLTGALTRQAAAEREVQLATTAKNAEMRRAQAEAQRTAASMEGVTVSANTTRYALYQVAAAYAGMANAARKAVTDIVGTAVSFEASFAQVARTTDLGAQVRDGSVEAKQQLESLRAELIKLSTQIPVSFGDLTVIASLGAQLGIATADVEQFTEIVAKFAATTNVTAEQAATYFGRLQNILGVPTAQFKNLASAVSQLGVDSVATETEILAVSTQIGAMANNAGFSAQYVIGLSTALASVRVAPELARGTTTRVFQQITRAAAEGGTALDAYAKVLGITSEAAASLWKTDPDLFFSKFITGLGKAAESGTNLTGILDDLGIKNSRDVPVITRLAGSYKLLAQYTDKAFTSFQSGTFLDRSFQTIADSTAAALARLSHSFDALKDSLGSAFLKPLGWIADALNAFLTLIGTIPTWITAGIVSFVAAVGVLFALRAALALAGAGLYAFKAAQDGMNVTSLKSGPLLGQIITLLGEHALAATAAATATTRAAASVGTLAAATAAAAGPVGVLDGELGATAVAGAGAAIGAEEAAVGIGSIAPAAVVSTAASIGLVGALKAIAASIGPIGWIFLGVTALAGIVGGVFSALDKSGKEANAAAENQRKLNETFLAGGDGADALTAAIQKDTKAYKDAGNQINDTNGVYKVFHKTVTELADGSHLVVDTMVDSAGVVTKLGEQTVAATGYLGDFTSAVGASATAQPGLAAGVVTTNNALGDQVTAVGAATDAWRSKALSDAIMSTFNTPELQAALLNLGPNLKTAIQAGLKGGAAGVADYLKPVTDKLQADIKSAQDKLREAQIQGGKDPLGVAHNGALVTQLKEQLKVLQAQWTAYGLLGQAAQTSSDSINAAAVSTAALGAIGEALDLGDSLDGSDAATKTKDAIDAASTAFSDFVSNINGTSDLQGGLFDAFDKLGQSIADNGTEFTNFTEGGRANLSALSGAVTAFAATQDDAIKNQGLSAAQAEANISAFIRQVISELSNQGVDTSQLDFLNRYLVSLTGQPYNVVVNADTSAAIANVIALHTIIASTTGQGFDNLSKYGGSGTSHNVGTLPKPTAAKTLQPTQVRASVAPSMLNAALSTARAAQEAKNLAKDQKGAGQAAKGAGDSAKKAADDASAALKKQQEYVKDLGGFYEDLASKAFSPVEAQGKTFESLQKLGQSLVENGKVFNTVTDLGRKNFSALTDVFDSFGKTLSIKIQQGVLSAGDAASQYREFAKGVYGELVSLGVPTEALSGFFKALGVDATGWTGNNADVQQFGGFITAAAEATAKLNDQLDKAATYADTLGTALTKAYDRFYGLGHAVDAVQSAMNDLKQSYQDNIDKVEELRKSNAGLAADLTTAQADQRQAQIEQAISVKYGETDRAASFGAKADVSGAKVTDLSGQIAANQKEAATLVAGRNALDGFTTAAIANRASLSDLQKTMLDQITAYAATGASTEQVTAYTETLRQQFITTATSAGFTATQIQSYVGVFDNYISVIKSVPNTVTTTATADTAQATSALNAIPKSGAYTINPGIPQGVYDYAMFVLGTIPKKADYTISPTVSQGALGSANNSINSLPDNVNIPLTFHVGMAGINDPSNIKDNLSLYGGSVSIATFQLKHMGGLIEKSLGKMLGGFASGGLLGGTPPANPKADNLMAKGPGGFYGLRSGEYVISQPGVRAVGTQFLDMINSGKYAGFASGGMNGNGGWGGSGPMLVELSPEDRSLLRQVASVKQVNLYANEQRIAGSVQNGNTRLAGRGKG